MELKSNCLNWFEIPATDMERAKKFYSEVFDIVMPSTQMDSKEMAFFPYEMGSGKVSGCLAKSEHHIPSQKGSVIYLNAQPDLSVAESRIEAAGGKILERKSSIGNNGFVCYFVDTEGNRVALHSMM